MKNRILFDPYSTHIHSEFEPNVVVGLSNDLQRLNELDEEFKWFIYFIVYIL